MSVADFAHLRVFGEYSLLHSAARIADVVERARRDGMTAVGVTDQGGLFGALSTYRTVRSAGLKPVLGLTAQVAKQRARSPQGRTQAAELVLLAASQQGYEALVGIASDAALNDPEGLSRNTFEEIAARAQGGVICLTGGRGGVLGAALSAGDERGAQRTLARLAEVFGPESVYVELQASGAPHDRDWLAQAQQVARQAGLPTVATAPVRHMDPQDLRTVDALQAIKDGGTLSDAALMREPGANFAFRTQRQMADLFRGYEGALDATMEIVSRTSLELPLGRLRLPRFPAPDGYTEEAYLDEVAHAGLAERRLEGSVAHAERLRRELAVIVQMGFAGYFLTVWDFVRYARENGISVGPGRGSAAGSLVAYALGVTDVEPLACGLLFERFLNPERVSMPDIDIDFETERRYEVIEYVARRYGPERVAQIGTFGTLAARAAIRDIGRVLQAPAPELDKLAARIPGGPGVTLRRAWEQDGEIERLVAHSPALMRVWELAQSVEGLPRHASTHAAGVVIAAQPLTALVPVMKGAEGLHVTQYAMEDIEALGLLKMDFLGLRTLTQCDRTVRFVERVRGVKLRYDDFSFDGATTELLARGDTDGCFQLESAGVKQVLREMRPLELEDLIAVISLYRPGPMEQIGPFLRARAGLAPIAYETPELEPILAPTYGIIVYQEQIMQIAAAMAGFSLGQADVLRRAVAKKKRGELDAAREQFVAGCVERGKSRAMAERVYDLIERFADYGFNRSHAAAYAVLALRTAHLKANYRAEFMAALISDSVSRPEKVAQYAEAARRAGVPILPPDVNKSDGDCVPERLEQGEIGIRLGFYAIKHVGVGAVEAILRARAERGPFSSLADFAQRVDARTVGKRVLEHMIKAGAFSGLGGSRRGDLAQLEQFDTRASRSGAGRQLTLLAPEAPAAAPPGGGLADDPREVLAFERELLGFSVSVDEYAELQRVQSGRGIGDLAALREQSAQAHERGVAWTGRLAGRLARLRLRQTRRGEQMAILTLEDASAQADVLVFPSLLRSVAALPTEGDILLVKARAGESGEWVAISVGTWQPTLYIRISELVERDPASLRQLRKVLLAHAIGADGQRTSEDDAAHGAAGVTLIYESGKARRLDGLAVRPSPALQGAIEQLTGRSTVRVT